MTTNFFDTNYETFKASAEFIGRICIEFAEQDGDPEEVSMRAFRDCFNNCDSAVNAMVFECIDISYYGCYAVVYTNGEVAVVLKACWEDWCALNNFPM